MGLGLGSFPKAGPKGENCHSFLAIGVNEVKVQTQQTTCKHKVFRIRGSEADRESVLGTGYNGPVALGCISRLGWIKR